MSDAIHPAPAAPPVVSVVMPVYNGARTIAESMDCVLGQTFRDLELLVIDDGSTDNTRDIVTRCTDPRVQFHSFKNRGPSASRNTGVGLSRGRYVAFIDADDLWTPEKLAKQVAELEAHPAAGLVYSLTDLIDGEGRFIGHGSHCCESGNVHERLVVSNFLENGSTPLLRRDVFDEVGRFNESLRMAEDWELWLRVAKQHSFACVPEAQVKYRIHAGATTSAKLRSLEEGSLRVLRMGLDGLPPASDRRRLEWEALSILYRAFTMRAILTATRHRDILPAFRYLRLYVSLGSRSLSELRWVMICLCRALVLAFVPFPVSRPVLSITRRVVRGLRGRD